ncbi:T-cell receptor beta chain V domain [Podarcis lilfordi]|nr:T-cell receptor beta chain V domain [Podarcis lilfordi]
MGAKDVAMSPVGSVRQCLQRHSLSPMSFHLLLALLLSSGSALDQSQDMVVKKGDNVTLDCSQKNSNYVSMYWYKQERKTHAQLQLVIYSTGTSDVEKEFKDRFKSPGTQNKRLSLICEGAQPEDTGTYFCAKQDHTVRHQLRKTNIILFPGNRTA